ncbi:MAG: hypothetical protein ACRDHG_10595, partial [Anaerolineales bacterium]
VTFLARVGTTSAGSGYFTLVFLGQGQEVARIRLPLEAGAAAEGNVTSDAAGAFEIPLDYIPDTSLMLAIRVPAADAILPGFATFEIPAH